VGGRSRAGEFGLAKRFESFIALEEIDAAHTSWRQGFGEVYAKQTASREEAAVERARAAA
jgi:hypothetical protein